MLTDDENQALEQSLVNIEDGLVTPELPALRVGRPAPPLEDYVAAHLEACRDAMVEYGLKNPDFNAQDRLARAESYARWRWQGYVNGSISSL